MATFGPQFEIQDQGTASIDRVSGGVVNVYFMPSEARLRAANRAEDPSAKVLLLRFDAAKQTTTLFPVNTMPTSTDFLKPKHGSIASIELVKKDSFFFEIDDFDGTENCVVPRTAEDLQLFLGECLPSGFTKDPNFGLGLDRKLSFITHALSQIQGVERLRLTDEKTLDVSLSADGKTYEMGYRLFDELRRGANRFDTKARASSRKKKVQSAYSNLLGRLDRTRFPVRVFERGPDDVADAIGQSIVDQKLSERDRTAVVNLAKASVRTTIKTQPEALVKLHDEIELASLDELITIIETKLTERAKEAHWQRLFEANPFILDLAFNVPVLLLKGQAHVGGKKLSGAGEKITDFLFANQLTDNVAVLEIKTPQSAILAKKEYRSGVFGPSSDLVGSVTQVLDQVNQLQNEIFRIKALNPEHRMESHGIRGVLVIGMVPESKGKRSFELYRNALHGISIITFDELLEKLRSLRTLLSTSSEDVPSA
jgi:hypothetical protein